MSQETNTGSSSGDNSKPRLTLKKKVRSEASAEPVTPEAPQSTPESSPPRRMTIRRSEPEQAPGGSKPQDPLPPQRDQPAQEETPEPPNPPPPPPEASTTPPLPSDDRPKKKVEAAEKTAHSRPPPGFRVVRDEDDEPPNVAAPPPPPPPPVTDLLEEAAALEQPTHHGPRPFKVILVAVIMVLFLGGGVVLLVMGLQDLIFGQSGDSEREVASPPPAREARAVAEEGASDGGLLGRVRRTVDSVNEKASTEEILAVATPDPTPPAPSAAPPAAPSPPPTQRPPNVRLPEAEPRASTPESAAAGAPVRNIEVIRWVEGIRPSGVGRGMMILDGKRYLLGETVNPQLELRWVEFDIALGLLVFEDQNGVRYEKDY